MAVAGEAGGGEAGGARGGAGGTSEAGGAGRGAGGSPGEPEVLVGDCEHPEEVVAACGDLPVIAHDAKSLGLVPPGLVHDTLLGAYLLEPARRGYPFSELCEERGISSALEDPVAADALLLGALAAWQREQIAARGLQGVMDDIELPLVRVLRDMERAGVHLNVPRLQEITARVRDEIAELEQEIFALADEEFLIASPSSSARSCSTNSASRASAAARRATQPTPACCRRSAPST